MLKNTQKEELLVHHKETTKQEKEKSIDFDLNPNKDNLISKKFLKQKYKLVVDDMQKVNEQSSENSTEMLRANNSKNINFPSSNVSGSDRNIRNRSIDSVNLLNKHKNINLNELDKNMNNNINININNNTNFFMLNGDKEINRFSSFDSTVLKSILKKPNNLDFQVQSQNLNNVIAKSVKKVSIEDHILPTCMKTKLLSILSITNLDLHVKIK